MQFTKATFIEAIKDQLPVERRVEQARIESAMTLALNEHSLYLISMGEMKKYDESLSDGDREVTVEGDSDDLLDIWAIKLTDSDGDYTICEYLDKDIFLRDWEADSDVDDGTPEYWTIFETSSGFPVVRFNRATDGAYTATIFYHGELTPETLDEERFPAPLLALSLAWFFGKSSAAGRYWDKSYKEMRPSMRARDKLAKRRSIKFDKTELDKVVDTTRWTLRLRRS